MVNNLYNPVGKAEITNAGLMVITQSGYVFFLSENRFWSKLKFS